jgi:plastocyanin
MQLAVTPLRIAAIGLLAMVAAGCGGSSATPTPEPTEAAAADAIEVIGNQFTYDPSEVTIPAAGSSTIRLVNTDVVEHDFTVDELGISIKAPVGGSGEATVTDAAPGTYKVYCTVAGHEAAGMVGSLVVTE